MEIIVKDFIQLINYLYMFCINTNLPPTDCFVRSSTCITTIKFLSGVNDGDDGDDDDDGDAGDTDG